MRPIINHTPIETSKVMEIIKFLGLNRDRMRIEISNSSSGFHGRASPWRNRISLRIPRFRIYRKPEGREHFRKGYLPYRVYSFTECFVYFLAHEIRHLMQGANMTKVCRESKKVRRCVMGTNAKLSEVDACLFGIRALRKFRREMPSGFSLGPEGYQEALRILRANRNVRTI